MVKVFYLDLHKFCYMEFLNVAHFLRIFDLLP